MGLEVIGDLLCGFTNLAGIGKEMKLKRAFNALCKNLSEHQPKADLRNGAAFQIGGYTALIQDDMHGYEIGYRMRDLKFIIGKDGQKKMDFWRDGIEFELAGAKRCDIAPDRWVGDFVKTCKQNPAVALDLPFDPRPDVVNVSFAELCSRADITGRSPNRPEAMWNAMQLANRATPQILQRFAKGSKPSIP